MRVFAAVYAVVALVLAATASHTYEPLPWLGVCAAAALLAGAAAMQRPMVMSSAAHAGLTATWAGTLAARMVARNSMSGTDLSTMWALLGMCGGMAVLISLGLKNQQPKPVPVKVKPSSRP